MSKINSEYIHRPWELTEIDLGDEILYQKFIKIQLISTKLSRNGTIKNLWKLRTDKLVKNESKRLLNLHVEEKNKFI